MFYQKYIKRLLDLIICICALIVFFPIFIIVALFVKLDSNGPLIFKQLRVGRNREEFYIYKFRTMKIDAPREQPTALLKSADKYITRTGRFLRKTSLDELPQLINIIKGDMSVIGPRPVVRSEKELIDLRAKYGVYKIRPGLSGWAQINGRDKVGIKDKVNLDNYYLRNISFFLDLKIFILTFVKVFRAEGISEGETLYSLVKRISK